jgi:hypothetical protein
VVANAQILSHFLEFRAEDMLLCLVSEFSVAGEVEGNGDWFAIPLQLNEGIGQMVRKTQLRNGQDGSEQQTIGKLTEGELLEMTSHSKLSYLEIYPPSNQWVPKGSWF